MGKTYRFIRRTHNVLGLIAGAQVFLWVMSGLFFTLFPIGQVRGDHLRSELPRAITMPEGGFVDMERVAGVSGGEVENVRLKPFPGGPVYEVDTLFGTFLHDATSGDLLSPLSEARARQVALAHWGGSGKLVKITKIETAPAESGAGGRSMWRADFSGADSATLWIDPYTGDLTTVRTPLWRTFDLMWGLHIMDWKNRETISSWWMKLFAFCTLMLVLAGLWLTVRRLMKGMILR